jgi:hypothetical protein
MEREVYVHTVVPPKMFCFESVSENANEKGGKELTTARIRHCRCRCCVSVGTGTYVHDGGIPPGVV